MQCEHNSRGGFVLTLAALFTTGLSAVDEGHPDVSISLEWHVTLELVLRPVTPPTVQRSPVTSVCVCVCVCVYVCVSWETGRPGHTSFA